MLQIHVVQSHSLVGSDTPVLVVNLSDLNCGGSPKNKLGWCKKEGYDIQDISSEMRTVNARWLQKAKERFKFMTFAKNLIPAFATVAIRDDGQIA